MSKNLHLNKCESCRRTPLHLWRITDPDSVLPFKFCTTCSIEFLESMGAKTMKLYLQDGFNVYLMIRELRSFKLAIADSNEYYNFTIKKVDKNETKI